jgi:uncharacterized protein Usg
MAMFQPQFEGKHLTTAQIFYHLPDYDAILQEYIWQDYDTAPRFPNLFGFLSFWEKEIEGRLHSVYVARQAIITPDQYRFADWMGHL